MQSVGTHGDSYSFPKRKAAQFRPENFFVAVRSRNSETAQLQRKVPERVVGFKTHPPPGSSMIGAFPPELVSTAPITCGRGAKKGFSEAMCFATSMAAGPIQAFTLSE